jgi:hypothetical protein
MPTFTGSPPAGVRYDRLWYDRDAGVMKWHTSDPIYTEERTPMTKPTEINVSSLLEYAANDWDAYSDYAADMLGKHNDAIKERKTVEARIKGSTGRFPGELTDEQVNAFRAVELMRADAIMEQNRRDAQNAAAESLLTPQYVKDAESAALRAAHEQSEIAKYPDRKALAEASAEAFAAVRDAVMPR